jgi:hypothetical protein
MYAEITVVAASALAMTDVLGLEASTPEAVFTRLSADDGETVVIRCSGPVWDRLRPQLRKLSQRRVPVMSAGVPVPGRTMPAMTYTQEWIPGDRPRIHQVDGAVTAATDSTVTVVGENLIPGARAKLNIVRQQVNTGGFLPAGTVPLYTQPEIVLTITAVAKGPVGNLIGILIKEATGAGSVTTEEYADGQVRITVVPAAASNTATAIAAQINGDALANVWVSATAVIGAALIPAFSGNGPIAGPNVDNLLPWQYLDGGDGAGLAFDDILVSGVDPTNRLRITAQRSGNQGNMISITLRMSQAGNSVTVSGSDIVVDRTGATETLANLVTAINAPGSAAIPFIKASAVGVGSLGAVSKTYLVGGAGEQVSAQIGGAPATIREQGDTSMLVDVLGTALTAAGVATGDVALVNLLLDYQRLSASLVVA